MAENLNPDVGWFTLFLELAGYWFDKRHRNRSVMCVVSVFTQFKFRGFCCHETEVYSEPSHTSNMKVSVKIVNGSKQLNISAKSSILDV